MQAINTANRVLLWFYSRKEGFFLPSELASRTALTGAELEAALEALRLRGHRFEHSPLGGVRLVRPVRPDACLIEEGLHTRRVGRHVICFDEVDSTNDVAADSSHQPGADGLAVLAESQRRGRGRFGRQWVSPPGTGVLMSVLLLDPERHLAHEALTIAAGLAVAEGIEEATGLRCRLKWPNDVLLEAEKVSGVLVEVRNGGAGRRIVVGIGVNVNAAPARQALAGPATCLAEHLGGPVERVEVARAVLRRLDRWVDAVQAGQSEPLHARWLQRCGMLNERLRVRFGGQVYAGRVLDISPREGLVLACDDGRRLHLPAGGTTVLV